jgi:hypothetical protein
MLEKLGASSELRDWLTCVVKPITDHLDSLGVPSWYARFLAQAVTDPALREVVYQDSLASPSMRRTILGLNRLLPVLPREVVAERGDMTRHLIVHTCAERERSLQNREPTPRASWDEAAFGMVDALHGLWRAPVRALSQRSRRSR